METISKNLQISILQLELQEGKKNDIETECYIQILQNEQNQQQNAVQSSEQKQENILINQFIDILPIYDPENKTIFEINEKNQTMDLQLTVKKKQANNEFLGSVSLSLHQIMNSQKSQIIQWLTLFDDPLDDLYDGDFLEQDLEIPRILVKLNILEEKPLMNTDQFKKQDISEKAIENYNELNLQQTPIQVKKIEQEHSNFIQNSDKSLYEQALNTLYKDKQRTPNELLNTSGLNYSTKHSQILPTTSSIQKKEYNYPQVYQQKDVNLGMFNNNYLHTQESYNGDLNLNNELYQKMDTLTQELLIQEKKYQVLQIQHETTINDYSAQISFLKEENKSIQELANGYKQQLEEEKDIIKELEYEQNFASFAQTQQIQTESQLQNLQDQLEKQTLQTESLQEQLSQKISLEETLKSELQTLQVFNTQQEQKCLQYQEQTQANQQIIDKKNEIIKELEQKIQDLEFHSDSQLGQMQEQEMEQKIQLQRYQEQIDLQKSMQDEKNSYIKLLEQRNEDMSKIIDSKQSEIQNHEKRILEQKQFLQNQENDNNFLKQNLEKQENKSQKIISDLQKQLDSTNLILEQQKLFQNEFGIQQKQVIELEAQKQAFSLEREQFQSQLDKKEKKAKALKEELTQKMKIIDEITYDFNKAKMEIQNAQQSNKNKGEIQEKLNLQIQDYEKLTQEKINLSDDLLIAKQQLNKITEENKKFTDIICNLKEEIQKLELLLKQSMKAPRTFYIAKRGDKVDETLCDFLNKTPVPIRFTRLEEGQYQFGTKKIHIKVQQDNNNIVCRVGGGYVSIEEFLRTYTIQELQKISHQKNQDSSSKLPSQQTLPSERSEEKLPKSSQSSHKITPKKVKFSDLSQIQEQITQESQTSLTNQKRKPQQQDQNSNSQNSSLQVSSRSKSENKSNHQIKNTEKIQLQRDNSFTNNMNQSLNNQQQLVSLINTQQKPLQKDKQQQPLDQQQQQKQKQQQQQLPKYVENNQSYNYNNKKFISISQQIQHHKSKNTGTNSYTTNQNGQQQPICTANSYNKQSGLHDISQQVNNSQQQQEQQQQQKYIQINSPTQSTIISGQTNIQPQLPQFGCQQQPQVVYASPQTGQVQKGCIQVLSNRSQTPDKQSFQKQQVVRVNELSFSQLNEPGKQVFVPVDSQVTNVQKSKRSLSSQITFQQPQIMNKKQSIPSFY